jgi:hypothetical protein
MRGYSPTASGPIGKVSFEKRRRLPTDKVPRQVHSDYALWQGVDK